MNGNRPSRHSDDRHVLHRRVGMIALIVLAVLVAPLVARATPELAEAMAKLREYQRGEFRRVPDQAGGVGGLERCATRFFQAVFSERAHLSPTERAEMGRSFLRPNVPGGGPWPIERPLDRTFLTPHFKFWYTTRGRDAVPSDDVSPGNGVPDYVDITADAFERAFEFEVNIMGFRRPLSDFWTEDNGGDDRWDVYLFNAPFLGVTVGDWFDRVLPTAQTAVPYFGINSRMYEYFDKEEGKRYVQTTVAHEFHHASQYAYNGRLPAWVAESAATWMESRAYDGGLIDDGDAYNDPEEVNETNGVDQVYQQLRQWFNRPEVALHKGGGHAYGNVIFMNYLTERFGVDFIREMYEEFTTGGAREYGNFWDLLATKGTNWVETFKTFTVWNYFTFDRANLFPGYRFAERYPPIGIRPTDRHRVYPVAVRYGEREMPDAMGSRYVVFEPPAGGFDGTFSIRIKGGDVNELIEANGLLDFTEGKPDPVFYERWLDIVGLRGWAAPVIIEKRNGEIVREEIFPFQRSQEGQLNVEGFGSDIRRIVLILVNIRPDAEERGNYISYAAGSPPRGSLSNLTATPSEIGGVQLQWQLDDLTDIRQVYVIRKRFSPLNRDLDNANFTDAAEVIQAGDREGNSIPDGVMRIVARLSPTDTSYLDTTTFEDTPTQSPSFDPTQIRYFYAVVPVDGRGIMGAPAIAPEGVTPVPKAAPAFMVATREVRVGQWDIAVRATRSLRDVPEMRVVMPDGSVVPVRLNPVEPTFFEGRFDFPYYPRPGVYRYSVQGVSQAGVPGGWILSGGTFRYAPSSLKPRVQIVPNRVHRIGDGPIEFYPRGMTIRIYNFTGQFIDELTIDSKWDGTNSRGEQVAPGVYFYVAEDGRGFRETGRLVLR